MKSLKTLDKILHKKLSCSKSSDVSKLDSIQLLFECNSQFKNKFYFENLTDESFFDLCGAKDDFVIFYNKIIKSGVGCIILGGINVGIPEKYANNYARISLDENILSKYKQVTNLAHSLQTKILLKINASCGRFKNAKSNTNIANLSSNFCLRPDNKQKFTFRISDNKCNELIGEIVRTSMLATISGFDGVVVDASLSNVIGELSSQEFNNRVFGYFSNTTDFLNKILKNLDTNNKLIVLKVSILSLFCYSKTEANLCKINKTINTDSIISNLINYIRMGVDGFEFVFGRIENEFLSSFNGFQEELLFQEFISEFREYLNENNIKNKKGEDVLIFYHDNFSNYDKLNDLIKENIVSLVDVTKNIYSDLNFLNQTKNANYLQNCLKCSYCNMISNKNQNIECLINPALTDFNEIKINNKKNTIVVIGSGISGLICALTLASRGYKVDIFEQDNEINHYGKLSTVFGFDVLLSEYYKTIEKQIYELVNKKIINMYLNQKFIIDNEKINKYYSIIVATGFKIKFLSVSGSVQNHVVNIYDSLENNKKLLTKKNIVIYAKSTLSLKLALYLVENKKNVGLIIKDSSLFKEEKNANMMYYFYRLYEQKVNIFFNSRITKINEDNIDVIINKNLESKSIKTLLDVFSNCKIKTENKITNIDCDCLIYEPEITPNNSLYADIVNKRYKGQVYLIGNALENSSLAEIIKSGYFVGKNV